MEQARRRSGKEEKSEINTSRRISASYMLLRPLWVKVVMDGWAARQTTVALQPDA